MNKFMKYTTLVDTVGYINVDKIITMHPVLFNGEYATEISLVTERTLHTPTPIEKLVSQFNK